MKKFSLIYIFILGFSICLNAQSLQEKLIDNDKFVSFKFGYIHLHNDMEIKSGAVTLDEKQNSPSRDLALELGFEYNKNIELSLNYQKVFNDDVNLDNIYLQSRYLFENDNYTPYVGALVGYSMLSWDKKPINTVNNDENSSSFMIGASAGVIYPIEKSFDFLIDYTFSYTNHSADLNPSLGNSATIDHDYMNSFKIGIRYSF